jgi:hypothetical protein
MWGGHQKPSLTFFEAEGNTSTQFLEICFRVQKPNQGTNQSTP